MTRKGREMQAANKSLIVTSKSTLLCYFTLLSTYKYGQQNALQVSYYSMQNSPCDF